MSPVDSAALPDRAVAFQQKCDAVQATILHHMADAHGLKLPYLRVPLPEYITIHGLMVILTAVLLVVSLGWLCRRRQAVPTGWMNLLEVFVVFIRDQVVRPYLGEEDVQRMTPFFCSLFFFILTMNLLGLIPSLYTATADVSVTGALALVILAVMTLGAMWRQGPLGFLKGFMPHGVPWPVLILLIPLEIVGLFIKVFALSIRLFANELAGHIVMYFMLGLLILFGVAASPFFLLAMFMFVLELFVAFLQAYIFTLLSAVFVGQRLHPEH